MTAQLARIPGPGGLCRCCWWRPAEAGWATCKPCFFRPERWRVACSCSPVLAETAATQRINQRHNEENDHG